MSWAAQRGSTRDVLFLGAGFSISASSAFPDTNALGRRALAMDDGRIRELTRHFDFGSLVTFEAWLTRLAEKQPYDSEEARFTRASDFARAQTLIAKVLVESLETASEDGLPGWLYDLVEMLHLERSTVVSLNYDTLLELAIDRTRSFSRGGDTRADANRALNYISIPVGTWDSLSARTTRTLKLYKLHGSIDWFWVPGDITGTSLIRHRAGAPRARAQAAGRSRYIVPPTTTKSSYFDNATSRFMWAEAARALASCDRVVFMGYSLPITDTAIASMIAEHMSPGAEIWVADLRPDLVSANLRALGVSDSRIHEFEGPSSIADVVALLVAESRDRLTRGLESFAAEQADLPVALYWDREHTAAILEGQANRAGDCLVLRSEAITTFGQANRSRPTGDSEPRVLRSADLVPMLSGVRQVRVIDADGREWPVGDYGLPSEWTGGGGHSSRWLGLKGVGPLEAASHVGQGKPFDLRHQPRIFTGEDEPDNALDGDIWLRPGP